MPSTCPFETVFLIDPVSWVPSVFPVPLFPSSNPFLRFLTHAMPTAFSRPFSLAFLAARAARCLRASRSGFTDEWIDLASFNGLV